MKSIAKLILTLGLILLCSGLVLPYLMAALHNQLSSFIYNVLQLGGLGLTIVGLILRQMSKSARP